jgi:hypothetical protein
MPEWIMKSLDLQVGDGDGKPRMEVDDVLKGHSVFQDSPLMYFYDVLNKYHVQRLVGKVHNMP